MKIFKKILFFLPFFLAYLPLVSSQNFYRISCDFSIKVKKNDGTAQLTMGKVYYDCNFRKLVYVLSFPQKEIWINTSEQLIKIAQGKAPVKQSVPSILEFTVFQLAMNGQLSDYGLKNSSFTVEEVEKEDNQIITTWKLPTKYSKKFGKIMTSVKDRQLYGIVFLDTKGSVISKQFFDNYILISGLSFPTEIIQISYIVDDKGTKENYQLTNFKNVIVNEKSNENYYNYTIP